MPETNLTLWEKVTGNWKIISGSLIAIAVGILTIADVFLDAQVIDWFLNLFRGSP